MMAFNVDIWTIALDDPAADMPRLRSLLSGDEFERMERFRFEHLQRHFAVAHGALRLILSTYLKTQPERIQFALGHRKKPALADPPAALEFNLTHSGQMAAVAVADCPVGIDVERVRAMPDLLAVASRFFAPAEAAEVQAAPEPERTSMFFRIWTRKEAFVKCVGDGLYMPLDSFRVSSGPEAQFLGFQDPSQAGSWQVHAFDPGEGYSGAIVYAGDQQDVRQFPFLSW